MNASALLQNQGWRGQGFSLDHSDRGLAKPLLVSRKSDLAGLGSKKNDFGNQWWTDAFDRSLKGLANGQTAVITPVVRGSAVLGRQSSGLYGSFVKAETLSSTIVGSEMKGSRGIDKQRGDTAAMAQPNGEVSTFGVLGLPPAQHAAQELQVEIMDKKKERSKKRKLAGEDTDEKKEKKSKKAKKATEESGARELSRTSHAPSFGVLGLPPSQASQEPAPVAKEEHKKSKKRKLLGESGDDVEHKKKRKKQKGLETLPEPELFPPVNVNGADTENSADVDADFIKLTGPAPLKPPKNEKVKKVKKANMTPQQRAELQTEKRTKRKAKAALRRAMREKKAQDNARQKREALLRPGPAHPESIAGLRESGQEVHLPGDEGDEETLMVQLIRCLERGQKAYAKELLKAAGANHVVEKKIIHSSHKQAKHWVVVRANPHLYRPTGTIVPKADVLDPSLPEDEAKAKLTAKKAAKEQKKQRKAEKFEAKRAERATKREEKAAKQMTKREAREAKRAKARS